MAVSGGIQAYSQYQQGAGQAALYNSQADAARLQGQQVMQTADLQSRAIQDTAKVQGKQQAQSSAKALASQRAAMAAAGMDPGSVTAADIRLDSLSNAKMDEEMIKYNANLRSWEIETGSSQENWALQTQATQYNQAAGNAKKAGKINANSSLL